MKRSCEKLAVILSLCTVAVLTGCHGAPHFKAYPMDDSARGMNSNGELLVRQGDGHWAIADKDGHARPIAGLPANAAPQALNDRGDVAGVIFTDPACQSDTNKQWCRTHPFLLAGGKLTEFDGLGVWSAVSSLTEKDDLGGAFHETDAPDGLPFVVLNGKVVRLTLPAPWVHGQITQMDRLGQGVGTLWDANNQTSTGFMEDGGKVLPFPNLDGGSSSFGVVIDEHANLGGSQRVGDLRFATTIQNGTVRAVSTPGLADCTVEAMDMPEMVLSCHPEKSKDYALYFNDGTNLARLGDIVDWPGEMPQQNSAYCNVLLNGRLLVTYSPTQSGAGPRQQKFLLVKQTSWPLWMWVIVLMVVLVAIFIGMRMIRRRK